MAGLYSTRFFSGLITTALATLYTVPAGNVAIIRTITLGWTASGTTDSTCEVLLTDPKSQVLRQLLPHTGGNYWQDGRVVLPAGEKIQAICTVDLSIWCTISGYLLSAS